ncbi:hypothetical protein PPL_02162 [Heterostelium album PN500]|uniref:Signal recognition particle SRP54 subunit M-domain domain-containing protein n=1 Tax=Heterostelium pallidum (strain ATCC 26659 / Pp 5 / PN500) TaxID=670386 RepID=D3B1I8_HETP5|nr:hypothetical protein PPL_02162 [Heterostelium album PN500]EFA85162.1 hypothetical protein PPL_02162 [Heterostelium album PN500]|eukprot:XP_020437271.1 hypothetical protein PPL_02162 [Heterostelium album PN500]
MLRYSSNQIIKCTYPHLRLSTTGVLRSTLLVKSSSSTTVPQRSYFNSTKPSNALFDVFSKLKNVFTGPEKEDPKAKSTTKDAPKEQKAPEKVDPETEKILQARAANDDAEFNKMLEIGRYNLNDFRTYLHKTIEPSITAGKANEQVAEFQIYIKIIDAMTNEERENPRVFQKYAFKIKQRINQEAGTTPQQFSAMFDTYNNARQIFEILARFKSQGKEIPKKSSEIQKFFKDNKDVIRKEIDKMRKERRFD